MLWANINRNQSFFESPRRTLWLLSGVRNEGAVVGMQTHPRTFPKGREIPSREGLFVKAGGWKLQKTLH